VRTNLIYLIVPYARKVTDRLSTYVTIGWNAMT